MTRKMDNGKFKIIAVLPALNEEKTIGDVLDKILNLEFDNAVIDAVVVDDGSEDATARIALAKGAKVISHGRNRGVGAAFRSGVQEAVLQGADLLVNIDSDGQFDPRYIPDLVKPIIEGNADFVTASRFIDGNNVRMPAIKKWGNHQIARLVSSLTGQRICDVSCGFRAYSKRALLNLNLIGDFTYTHETILTLAFKGFNIMEVPVPVRGTRKFGKSRVANNIFRYALQATMIILRSFRDHKPMLLFGVPGIILAIVGFALLGLFLTWSTLRGEWFPKSAAFTSAFCILSAIVFFLIALITDMFTRIRVQIDNLMQFVVNKKREHGKDLPEQ